MRRGHPGVAALAAALLGASGGCSRFGDDDAVALVRAYNRRVVEAFAAGDPRLVEEVAGPEEARKLLGLIGVKADAGLRLHSRMDELAVDGVDREGGEIVVRTRERWSYEDRSPASGERVGPGSTDSYEMRYHLGRVDGRWVVRRIEFASPPVVGRAPAPMAAPPSILHGVAPAPPAPAEGR